MKPVECFGSVASADAVLLILGSIPGITSLQQAQYYAHPKNLFWDIMAELFDAGKERPYAERLLRLKAHRVALWDVIARCQRPGSLDSNIRAASVVVNDFQALFAQCPQLRMIVFNGKKAAALFHRLVLPELSAACRTTLQYQTLPSTSPAFAAMPAREKIDHWQQSILPLVCPGS